MKKKPAKTKAPKPAKRRLRDQSGIERQRTMLRLAGYGLVTALLIVIVMMIASSFFPTLSILNTPRRLVARFITPIQEAFAGATDGVVTYLRKLKLQDNLMYEYEQLRQKYDEMTDRAMLADELRRQLQEQANLSDEMARNPELQGIKANVIGGDTSNYTMVLTIDVGRDQGVEDHMAVVQPGALVGYTFNVGKDRANVRCIVDSNSQIPALITSSRDEGHIKGTLAIDGQYATRMYYVNYTSLPRPGDLVVTSGKSLPFPKGIPIGTVRESTRGLDDNKQFIVVEPAADFNHMEYVIVYRYRPAVAEEAQARVSEVSASFEPIPELRPVPTLIGQKEPELTPGPDGQMPETPTPSPSPSPTPTPSPTPDPNATPLPEGVSYNMRPVLDGTPTPEPTPEPTPSPEPSPTFSVDQMTVEEDN